MAITVRQLHRDALGELGVLGEDESASTGMASLGLRKLNQLLDQWAGEGVMVYATTRTIVDLADGQAAYRLAASEDAATTSDGFDTSWSGVPTDWTKTTTGNITVTNDTVTYQAGGHSIFIQTSDSGTCSIYRDIDCSAGQRCAVSLWLTGNGADGLGTLRIQNTQTGNYLTSDGDWQADVAEVFSSLSNGGTSFVESSLAFYLEPGSPVPSTLRITLYFSASVALRFCRYDTFSFTNYGGEAARPAALDYVNLIDTNQSTLVERPLDPLTDQAWAATQIKSLSGLPTAWYYNPEFPYGNLTVWPIPDRTGLQAVCYRTDPLRQFGSLNDIVSLPQGYERMLVKNLALELAPSYEREPSRLLVLQAADALKSVKTRNWRPVELSFEAASVFARGGRGMYDIRTDR